MIRVLAITIVIIGSVYELGVQALALTWFWGGFSTCERFYLFVPLFAILTGAIAVLIFNTKAALPLAAIAPLLAIAGFGIAAMANSRSELLCRAPIAMNYSWTFFVVVGILGVFSGWRLAQRWTSRKASHLKP